VAPLLVSLAVGASEPPPGLARVAGGPTWMGTELDELERLAADHPAHAAALFDELALHERDVETFDLMVTEVTHEQYATFLRASGARPPVVFAPDDVLDEARGAFVEAQGRRIREARAAGLQPPERRAFDVDRWWDEHWREHAWSVPAGRATHPVRGVAHVDARAYADWAGLRLMTEHEYVRAARGDTRRTWSFAAPFAPERAASLDSTGGEPVAVGSFPPTGRGFFDLCGNVWELTDSPYRPFPSWSVQSVDVPHAGASRMVRGTVPWDSNRRIVVGGSAASEELALRVAGRRPIGRHERRSLVGFRCAASVEPLRDRARVALDARGAGLRTGHAFAPDRAAGLERWHADRGSASVPGYARITGYDALLALPAVSAEAGGTIALRKRTRERGPVPIAFVHQTLPSLEPALPAGDYVVLFRGAGREPTDRERREVRVVLPADVDLDDDRLLFLDATGRVAAHVTCPRLDHERNRASTVERVPSEEGGADDTLRFELSIPEHPDSRRGFRLELALRYGTGSLAGAWRASRER